VPSAIISGALAINRWTKQSRKRLISVPNFRRRAIATALLARWISGSIGARDECRVAHQGTHGQACLMQPALERSLADAGDLGRLAR
jgi:hypothetical protein